MSTRRRLQAVGVAILVIGFAVAAPIWLAQDRLERAEGAGQGSDADQSLLDSRKSVRQLQVMYGQSGVIFEEWSEWLKSLWHGKRLAMAIGVVSTVSGLACLLLADQILALAEVMKTPPEENQSSS